MRDDVKIRILAPFLFNVSLQLCGECFEARAGIGGFEFGDDAFVALFFQLLLHRDEAIAVLENPVHEHDLVAFLRLCGSSIG